MKPAGYKIIDGGRYQDGTEDYTSEITKFKAGGAEICLRRHDPAGLRQLLEAGAPAGLPARCRHHAKALLFPSELEAMGSIGYGLTCDVLVAPHLPFKSSLTGETCQQFADDCTTSTSKQWTQPLMHYLVFEIVADALKRTETRHQGRHRGRREGDQSRHARWPHQLHGRRRGQPRAQRATTPLAGGQWIKGTKYPFDLVIVSNAVAPDATIQQDVTPLVWS